MNEYFRPWKLTTFAIGMAWLLWGAVYHQFSDWDIGISLIMGILAYLTAPWCVQVLIERRYRMYPLALIAWIVTVDTSYCAYHWAMGNAIIRDANFITSTLFYFICGFFWLHKGPLIDLFNLVAHPVASAKQAPTCAAE